MELATSHQSVSREMVALMREMELELKAAGRKGNAVIYFKQSDRIEDLLTAIGAPVCAMEVMNAKLEKDLRGSVNRRVNCDAANLDKAVEAALIAVAWRSGESWPSCRTSCGCGWTTRRIPWPSWRSSVTRR